MRELPPGATPDLSGGGYELNFENAPVATVAKVILGDILESGYTIDPRVQGTITLASGRAVPKAELVYVLENALRMSNVALVRDAARDIGSSRSPRRSAAAASMFASRGGPEAGLRDHGHSAAISFGADAAQAARQLRGQARNGAGGSRPKHPGGARAEHRAPHRSPRRC